jgi:SAM-dependent methyltransferase
VWLRELFRRERDRNQLWRGHDLMTKAEFIAMKIQHCVPSGARHLDIACGGGQILRAFDRIGCKSVGIELSEWRSAKCRQQGLPVVRADMAAGLPFKNATFDVVTLISTIEHVLHPNALIEESNRVLSPNGLIIIQIPNPYFPIDLHYFLPLYGYLPSFVQRMYRRLVAGQEYAISYYTAQVSKRDLATMFAAYTRVHAQDIVYPIEVAPNWLKPFYSFYKRAKLCRLFPTGHLFVYRKTQHISSR